MSIRNRIFLVFVVAAAIAIAGLINWMQDDLRPRYLEAQEEPLVDFSHVLAALIETRATVSGEGAAKIEPTILKDTFAALKAHQVDAQIYGLHKTDVDLRIYVTDELGTVVFDSDADRDLGADYSRWRDVQRTLQGEYGARMTEGDPIFPAGNTMYIAAPIRGGGEIIGVVSVGKPTRNAERFLSAAIPRFTRAAIVALVGALLIAWVIYAWVSRPLAQVHAYAHALQAGRKVAPPALGDNEIGRVAEAMRALRDALDGKHYVEAYVQALAHELKSPTAAIRGASELLAEDLPPEDQKRFLNNIRAEAHRLEELLERILELSALENRDNLEQTQQIALTPLLEQVTDGLQPLASQAQVSMTLLGNDDLDLQGDPFLLHRALSNLLKNAIEFSPPGGTITLQSRRVQDTIAIEIQDQGPGLPDYAQARVFERFFSLPHARLGGDARKSTGLGLSFVREIATLHGGTVSLDNADAGGALARLVLPAA